MLNHEISKFAKILVRNIRDRSIRSSDVQLSAEKTSSPISRRWQAAKNQNNLTEFGKTIIADSVDDTIFHFLLAVDEGLINISMNVNGAVVPLPNDIIGELGGWYMGEWRSEYSEERCANDLDELGGGIPTLY